MKTKICAIFLTSLLFSPPAFPQGSLTPPGTPAPTMKTLDQVEARMPISALPFTISDSGSYYLTKNLRATAGQSGIVIQAPDVTLDLNGFGLFGALGAAGSHGINIMGFTGNVTVKNGSVNDWKGRGVSTITTLVNCRFIDLRIRNSGAEGLVGGVKSIVERCTVTGSSGDGISVGAQSLVKDCQAANNTAAGIAVGTGSRVIGCGADSNAGDAGIRMGRGCSAKDCVSDANTGGADGINGLEGCTVSSCAADDNAGSGIYLTDGGSVHDSSARFNKGIGIWVIKEGTVTNSNASLNNIGIYSAVVSSCTARANEFDGIDAESVTNSVAYDNNSRGIFAPSGVVAFCKAYGNSTDISATGATRTGNKPTP